ncbi:biotin/lipoyl-containing protein [Acinetobacter vivianii]
MARSEARDGWVDLFIELNGQLRLIQIQQQGTQAAQQRPQADPMNPAHLGASMPGMISTIPVKTGQSVLKGETLFTIEAMKMELAIKADSDCVIQEILVSPGMQVKNKDLVLVLQ